MQPVRLVAEGNAEATREMTGKVEAAAAAMGTARGAVDALAGTAERLRKLIAHFQLSEARRQAVNIPVAVRCTAWAGERNARVVDLSATGARIDGLEAPQGAEIVVRFVETGATYVMGVPTHAMDILADLKLRRLSKLGRVGIFYMAGSVIPPETARAFLDMGIKPQNIYGMTENGSHQYTLPDDDVDVNPFVRTVQL